MFGKINIKIMRNGLCAKRDHEAHEEDVEETVTNHTLISRKAQRYVVERTQETGCQNLLWKPQAWVFLFLLSSEWYSTTWQYTSAMATYAWTADLCRLVSRYD